MLNTVFWCQILYQMWYIKYDIKWGGKMKSSTYASIITIVFLKHKNHVSKSIESVIRTTDMYCKKLNLDNDLSQMTKYRITNELLKSNILSKVGTSKNVKLSLSSNIKGIF